MKKRWPSLLLGLAVSVIALVYLFRRDLGGVRDELADANYWTVIPVVALSTLGLWLRSIRWRVLLKGRLSPSDSFHILNISYFVNGVLPLRVGELARAVLALRADPPVPVLTSISTVVVERLLDTLAVFGLVGITLAVLPTGLEIGLVGVALGVGAIIGVIVLAVFAARPPWAHAVLRGLGRVIKFLDTPRLHAWVDDLLEGILPLASPRLLLQSVWWTAASWATSVAAGYVMLYAVFDHPTWAASMAMIALASFVVAVPAVPGNLGPFEAAIVFGIAAADLVVETTDPRAVALALILHAVNLATYIVTGLIGLWALNVNLGEVTRAAQTLRTRQSQSNSDLETQTTPSEG
jgi:uncharacterized protein (TIRG00374 family)